MNLNNREAIDLKSYFPLFITAENKKVCCRT